MNETGFVVNGRWGIFRKLYQGKVMIADRRKDKRREKGRYDEKKR